MYDFIAYNIPVSGLIVRLCGPVASRIFFFSFWKELACLIRGFLTIIEISFAFLHISQETMFLVGSKDSSLYCQVQRRMPLKQRLDIFPKLLIIKCSCF